MVAGPEVARAIEEFQDGDEHWGGRVGTRHHDQTPRKMVCPAAVECPKCKDWPRAVPCFHRKMPGGKNQAYLRRHSSKQAEGVQYFQPEKCEQNETAGGLSQE